jgi:hypothetical protein
MSSSETLCDDACLWQHTPHLPMEEDPIHPHDAIEERILGLLDKLLLCTSRIRVNPPRHTSGAMVVRSPAYDSHGREVHIGMKEETTWRTDCVVKSP